MKICIISSFSDLLIKDTGYSVRIHNLAVGLGKIGNEVDVIIPGIEENTIPISNNVNVHIIKGFIPIFFLKFVSDFLHIKNYAFFYFYDPFFILKTSKILRNSDIIQLEQPWAGGLLIPFAKIMLRKPVIIDSHDVLQSLRIPNINFLRKIVETFLEKLAYYYADLLFVVSNKEKELLSKYNLDNKKIHVIKNGVDINIFSEENLMNNNLEKKYGLENYYKIIFVGNMEYYPNQEAMHIIATQLAPQTIHSIKNVKFIIVGRCPEKYKIESPHLLYTGTVENIVEYLKSSDLAIAPIYHGSGTRLKILEYFACGLPVVSTSMGVEGLNVKDGVNILIENDINEFSIKSIKLLNDKKLSEMLGKSARNFVVNNYNWENIVKNVNNIYKIYLTKNTR